MGCSHPSVLFLELEANPSIESGGRASDSFQIRIR